MMELGWLKKIDFFPPWQPSWGDRESLCVATKSRNLGDALALSTLPRKLKQKYPHLKVYTYPRGFNPIVFRNNPCVDGVVRLPDAVFGDDANFGSGQLIQQKEEFFGVDVSAPPRPEIHLSQHEKTWASRRLEEKLLAKNRGKELCLLHAWGTTNQKVAPVSFWDAFVRKWSDRYRFWQVGLEGHSAVQGCEFYFLLPPARRHARKLFALASRAGLFIGVDSGPMHVARAFDVPSIILTAYPDPAKIFEMRAKAPYFLHQNWKHSTLYRENAHVGISPEPSRKDLARAIDEIDGLLSERTLRASCP